MRAVNADEVLESKIRAEIAALSGELVPACAVEEAKTLTLNTLRDEIYADAVAHGLWEEYDGPTICSWVIREETRELDDAAKDWEDYGWSEEEPDDAFSEELADVIIAAFSVAGKLGIDVHEAVMRKMAINRERPWKHGKVD